MKSRESDEGVSVGVVSNLLLEYLFQELLDRLLAGCFCSGNIGRCLLLLSRAVFPRGQAVGEDEEGWIVP